MDSTVKDPEQATRMLQVDVIGTLPEVKKAQMLALTRAFKPIDPDAGAGSAERTDRSSSYKNCCIL